MRAFAITALCAAAFLSSPAKAQTSDTVIRAADTGPGLCVIVSIPGGHDFLYDAGHWEGRNCVNAVREVVTDRVIDLIIISHSDGDHLGQLDSILNPQAGVPQIRATRIIHTGHPGTSGAWEDAIEAIEAAQANGTRVDNLGAMSNTVGPGTVIELGEAKVTIIAGWNQWDPALSDGALTAAEGRNVISIVARLDYGGKSVLLTGDTIGRRIGSAVETCDHAERWMVRNNPAALRADVLFAPHHGGDNGSSACFIEAVRPRIVIFSAGHDHEHPTSAAAARYWQYGRRSRRFRTDYGDDEGGSEWNRWRRLGCEDLPGDDDLEIRVPRQQSRRATIRYLSNTPACR
jgi:beta-lactamase superfamily II metal-dependent hydrolase